MQMAFTHLYHRKDDGLVTNLATGSLTSLTSGSTYEAKVVVDEDPNNPNTQRLRFYIDADGDGFGDESAKLTDTTYIDQDWSVGMVGLYGDSRSGYDQEFDDVKVWIDNTGGQTMDDQQIDDNFDSNVLTLTHDHNGNLTDDGIHEYIYDAWNRLVEVTRRVDDEDTVAEYEYDGLHRRIEKVVSNSGEGVVPGSDDNGTGIQAGDRHEHYFYTGWSLIETRDDSDQTLAQWVWGTQYLDEPVVYDRNMDVGTDDDCLEAGDERYYYHQDANWRVVMLTDENGYVLERYDYTAYGAPRIFGGVSSDSEYADPLVVSSVGNPFMHQGLFLDPETRTYQNRFRQYDPTLGRFLQRDPLGYWDGMNLYEYLGDNPLQRTDAGGLCSAHDAPMDDFEAEIDRLRRRPRIVIAVPLSADKYYGFENRPGFWRFKEWLHRQWKKAGDPDLTKDEMEDAWEQWESEGRPDGDGSKERPKEKDDSFLEQLNDFLNAINRRIQEAMDRYNASMAHDWGFDSGYGYPMLPVAPMPPLLPVMPPAPVPLPVLVPVP